MTVHARLTAALILAGFVAAGCSPPPEKKAEPAQVEAPANPDVLPVRIGVLEAFALRDGDLPIPNRGTDTPWGNHADTTALLTAAGRPGDVVPLSIQPLLVKDGDRVVLIDTGAGGQMGVQSRLMASLRTAGVEPGQVTDILISHAHGDHIGGLVANGALVFPNATIRLSIPEWTDLQNEAALAELVRLITPRVQAFAPGSKVTPGITAVSLDGHTAGHSGYEIVSGEDRLLYIGDAMHSSILSVQRPEWRNTWDADNAAAVATRQGLLERGASQSLRIYGVHFPFPGVGRFQRQDDGFVWVAER
jgi:glyoxylase-like metal-dependent hydrolase (beta-lactamase superfamily II)